VAQTEALGSVTDGRSCTVGCSGDLKQQLMLLRLQPEFLSCMLAELEKQAESMAKLGESLELG
jgi:hypothetical protein